jgi:DNA-binding beta-propeller fold protein YncE
MLAMRLPRFSSFTFLCALILASGWSRGLHGEETTLVYPPRSHALGHRATSTHLKMFLGSGAEFDAPKGIACVKLTSWDDPKKESDDDELFLVLVNSGRKEILFNNSMITVSRVGDEAKVKFTDPRDVAADPGGNVYVTDAQAGSVTRLRLDEKNKLTFAGQITGGPGESDRLLEPVGLCATFDGKVYVADRLRNHIFGFDPEGKLLRTIDGGEAGEKGIMKPLDVEMVDEGDPWNFFKQSMIFVIDMDGRRIQKLSVEGKREAVIYAEDLPGAGATFHALAVDYYCQVYVTDPVNHCVHKFDRNLRYLTTCGKRGTGDFEFLTPTGIAIWKRFGQLFVADATGVQYFWVGTDLRIRGETDSSARIGVDAKGRKAITLSFDITEPSEVSVSLLVDSKKDEIPLLEWRRYYPLTHNLSFPLPELGEEEQKGSKLIVRARATYSSKGSFEKKITLPVRVSG